MALTSEHAYTGKPPYSQQDRVCRASNIASKTTYRKDVTPQLHKNLLLYPPRPHPKSLFFQLVICILYKVL